MQRKEEKNEAKLLRNDSNISFNIKIVLNYKRCRETNRKY
jgi:hypothetical protein